MPAKFSGAERTAITDKLLAVGFELFTTQGLRKTSLDELVKPAGIAKSSFYAFFDSKESLYLELMLRQVPALQERLWAILDSDAGTAEKIRRFLHGAIDILHHNPLYRRLVTHPDEQEAVARRIPPEQAAKLADLSILPVTGFIEREQEAGRLIPGDPRVLLGVLQTVLFLPSHSHQLDPDRYAEIVDKAIDVAAVGLTTVQ